MPTADASLRWRVPRGRNSASGGGGGGRPCWSQRAEWVPRVSASWRRLPSWRKAPRVPTPTSSSGASFVRWCFDLVQLITVYLAILLGGNFSLTPLCGPRSDTTVYWPLLSLSGYSYYPFFMFDLLCLVSTVHAATGSFKLFIHIARNCTTAKALVHMCLLLSPPLASPVPLLVSSSSHLVLSGTVCSAAQPMPFGFVRDPMHRAGTQYRYILFGPKQTVHKSGMLFSAVLVQWIFVRSTTQTTASS